MHRTRVMRALSVTPFATAVAVWLMIGGVEVIGGYGRSNPLAALLPTWEAAGLGGMMMLAGALILVGLAARQRGALICGLIFVVAVMVCRFVVYGAYLGYGSDFLTSGSLDVAMIWASISRLLALRRHEMLVRVSESAVNELPE